MHIKKLLLPSFLIIVLLISNSIIFPLPVLATSITVNPSLGTVGSTVTVNGENFNGRFATIYFDDRVLATDIPISPDGMLNFDIDIPNAPRGRHTIRVVDSSNWEASTASIGFKVIPRIKVFPLKAPEQSPISVTGYGFASNETDIKITWDGDIATPSPIKADRDGSWNTSFTIGDSKGEHYISAIGSSTEIGDIEDIMIIVTPWSTVTPLSGTVGTKLIIEGWGFRSGEDGITVTWDEEIILCNATAESDGSVLIDGSKRTDGTPRYELFVPPTTQGDHTIGLYGSSFTPRGILPDYDFDVLPDISIKPDTGNRGTEVTINGTGFAANELITINYDDKAIDTTSTSDTYGSFTATFAIPQSKGNKHTISTTGNKGNSGQVIFTILNEMPEAPQLIFPDKGMSIALFNSVGEVFRGAWRYLVNIRDYMKGTKTRIYTKTPTILTWSYGEATSDMNYTLHISQDNTFKTIVVDKENLDRAQYNLSENGMLPKGIYYWRVKAIDTKGNESEWSETFQFEVISMPTIVLVLSILCVILIVAAIAFGILFLLANRSRY